jgi:ribosome-interacting GTPase 1
MDHFGIGQAIKGIMNVYFRGSRQTGRTISLIESLRGGDRVVFTNSDEARRVKRMCLERKIQIEAIVVNPKEPQCIFERGSSQGRTILDHSWVEEFYLAAIEQCGKHIDHIQREASGFGEAHLETRRKAAEMIKWRF